MIIYCVIVFACWFVSRRRVSALESHLKLRLFIYKYIERIAKAPAFVSFAVCSLARIHFICIVILVRMCAFIKQHQIIDMKVRFVKHKTMEFYGNLIVDSHSYAEKCTYILY